MKSQSHQVKGNKADKTEYYNALNSDWSNFIASEDMKKMQI